MECDPKVCRLPDCFCGGVDTPSNATQKPKFLWRVTKELKSSSRLADYLTATVGRFNFRWCGQRTKRTIVRRTVRKWPKEPQRVPHCCNVLCLPRMEWLQTSTQLVCRRTRNRIPFYFVSCQVKSSACLTDEIIHASCVLDTAMVINSPARNGPRK